METTEKQCDTLQDTNRNLVLQVDKLKSQYDTMIDNHKTEINSRDNRIIDLGIDITSITDELIQFEHDPMEYREDVRIELAAKDDKIEYLTTTVSELDIMMEEFRGEVIKDMVENKKQYDNLQITN